ncbi:MAG: hypothetical protein IKV03_03230 [Alphaproteobacteria bacterium]|nr:hypothetical protein [Alphaproteobacteria bacterium]
MSNTMDDILVKYNPQGKKIGGSRWNLTDFNELTARLLETVEDRKNEITLPMSEFLKLQSSELSEKDQKIQKVFGYLYELNSKDPPIFGEFSKGNKPVLINCVDMPTGGEDTCGTFTPNTNEIRFNDIHNVDELKLFLILAHEMKHAEQSQGVSKNNLNSYQQHQLGFLDEVQAYGFEDRVYYSLGKSHPLLKEKMKNKVNQFFYSLLADEYQACKTTEEAERISTLKKMKEFFSPKLKYLYETYKDDYDFHYPIGNSDEGLKSLPKSYGFSEEGEKEIIQCLNYLVPREGRTPEAQMLQAIKNDDFNKAASLIDQKDKTGQYVISDNQYDLLILDCLKKTPLLDVLQTSERLNKKSILNGMSHMIVDLEARNDADQGEMENIPKENINKCFNFLISRKDEKGIPLVSKADVKEICDKMGFFNASETKRSPEAQTLMHLMKDYVRDTEEPVRQTNTVETTMHSQTDIVEAPRIPQTNTAGTSTNDIEKMMQAFFAKNRSKRPQTNTVEAPEPPQINMADASTNDIENILRSVRPTNIGEASKRPQTNTVEAPRIPQTNTAGTSTNDIEKMLRSVRPTNIGDASKRPTNTVEAPKRPQINMADASTNDIENILRSVRPTNIGDASKRLTNTVETATHSQTDTVEAPRIPQTNTAGTSTNDIEKMMQAFFAKNRSK